MAALLPNCMVEIFTGSANGWFGEPFAAIARIISFPVSGTDEKMLVTSLRNFLIVFIIRILKCFQKEYLSDSNTNMVPEIFESKVF